MPNQKTPPAGSSEARIMVDPRVGFQSLDEFNEISANNGGNPAVVENGESIMSAQTLAIEALEPFHVVIRDRGEPTEVFVAKDDATLTGIPARDRGDAYQLAASLNRVVQHHVAAALRAPVAGVGELEQAVVALARQIEAGAIAAGVTRALANGKRYVLVDMAFYKDQASALSTPLPAADGPATGEEDWSAMDSAPRDGTIVEVRSAYPNNPKRFRAAYVRSTGLIAKAWVPVRGQSVGTMPWKDSEVDDWRPSNPQPCDDHLREILSGLELTEDGYSLRTKYDGDADDEGRSIVVGGEIVATFVDSDEGEDLREAILAVMGLSK